MADQKDPSIGERFFDLKISLRGDVYKLAYTLHLITRAEDNLKSLVRRSVVNMTAEGWANWSCIREELQSALGKEVAKDLLKQPTQEKKENETVSTEDQKG